MSSAAKPIEMLSVTNSCDGYTYTTCYAACTCGDIECKVIDAIRYLSLVASESTIKKIVHDLKTVRLYKFDDYIFEVYYI